MSKEGCEKKCRLGQNGAAKKISHICLATLVTFIARIVNITKEKGGSPLEERGKKGTARRQRLRESFSISSGVE